MRDTAELWFPSDPAAAAGATQLVCIPHAGSGAGAYRGWQERLGSAAQVLPVQLPGREYRLGEPLLDDAGDVVDALVEPALAVLRPPYVLFGHSMGALLAFELAHALAARGRPPAHLVVSAFAAPAVGPAERAAVAGTVSSDAPDDLLVDYLRSLQGADAEVLAIPEFVEMLLPIVRADFALCERYRVVERGPLEVPVTVLSGQDDATVPVRHLDRWREATTGPTRQVRLPGGHFFLHDRLDAVLTLLTAVVGSCTAPAVT